MVAKSFCCYCGRSLLYVKHNTEHVVPRSKCGNNLPINKKKCCVDCNVWRDSKSLTFWKTEVQRVADSGLGIGGKYFPHDIEAILVNIDFMIEYVVKYGDKLLMPRLSEP